MSWRGEEKREWESQQKGLVIYTTWAFWSAPWRPALGQPTPGFCSRGHASIVRNNAAVRCCRAANADTAVAGQGKFRAVAFAPVVGKRSSGGNPSLIASPAQVPPVTLIRRSTPSDRRLLPWQAAAADAPWILRLCRHRRHHCCLRAPATTFQERASYETRASLARSTLHGFTER